MQRIRSIVATSFAVLGAALIAPAAVMAQAYPSKPITLVVAFPAGSTTDNITRKFAEYVRAKSNATVLVENRVGADGNIAGQHVLRQPADGYTVFMTGNSVHGANANLFRDMPFDPINDFAAVAGVMTIPMVLVVKPEFPANNVQEFVAEAKRRPKPMFFATGNNSTRGASELFKARFALSVDHVPYRGSPQVVVGLLAGEFDFAFVDTNSVGPFLKDGRLKGLAITSVARNPGLPTIPTVAESLPGFQFGAWVGVVVRAQTPPDVVARLATLVQGFTSDPATVSHLASYGATTMPMDSAQLKAYIELETRTWAEIVKFANIEKK
jgi:tripartite-type tricarboxylate transporter receptor subunit TctC